VLVAVNGEQNLDALALPERLADVTGPVSLTFRRADGEQSSEVEIELTPTEPLRTSSPVNTADNIVALDRLGLAFQALPTVSVVYPPSQTAAVEGDSQAGEAAEAAAGLRPGDVLKKVVARWADDQVPAALTAKHLAPVRAKLKEGWEFNAEYPLAALVELWQFFPAETPLRITVLRDGRIVDVDTQLSEIEGHWYDRGLRFAELERTHVADGLGHAALLGLEASKRRLTEVFRFLGMLVTGKASADLVGGPITIFRVAGHETSRGVPALLMFLTLLSMNLAILNFLPIPALDGGHMLFLTAEAVLGRPVNEKLQMQLTMAGVLALLSLMAFALFNDIRRL
jgi:regulator of sigma E protease